MALKLGSNPGNHNNMTKYGTITHSRPLGCSYAFPKVELLPLSTCPEYVWVYSGESWHTVCIIFKPYKYLVAAPAVVWHLLSFTVRDYVHGKIYVHSSCEDSNSFLAPRAVGLNHLPTLAALISKNHSASDEWLHVTLLIQSKHVIKIWYSSSMCTTSGLELLTGDCLILFLETV